MAAALNTSTTGVPLVVFNPLNIAREDLVEADVKFPGRRAQSVTVTGPDGKQVPAQVSGGKFVFAASVPSVGYAVYDVRPAAESTGSHLKVSEHSLENEYYRVQFNGDGDVASIFDKTYQQGTACRPRPPRYLLRQSLQWPAWNMDWDQEQAAPKAFVSGPAKIRVVENGPARVAIEISRETAGSRFVQTISLPQATLESASNSAMSSTGTRGIESQGHVSAGRLEPDGNL